MRQVRRLIFSVRYAHSSRSWPSRHSLAPYASSTAIRITEMGECTPASGRTPGMRRPVRTMTRPSICLRRIPFGLPTSPEPSGAIVAALMPKPSCLRAAAASRTHWFRVLRRSSSERSKSRILTSRPSTPGSSRRSASRRSSSPVWSPCSTAIVVAGIDRIIWPGPRWTGPWELPQDRAHVSDVAAGGDEISSRVGDDVAFEHPQTTVRSDVEHLPPRNDGDERSIRGHVDSAGAAGVEYQALAASGDGNEGSSVHLDPAAAAFGGVGLEILLGVDMKQDRADRISTEVAGQGSHVQRRPVWVRLDGSRTYPEKRRKDRENG